MCLVCVLHTTRGVFSFESPSERTSYFVPAQPPHWQSVPPIHVVPNCCTFILLPRSHSCLILFFKLYLVQVFLYFLWGPDASHTALALSMATASGSTSLPAHCCHQSPGAAEPAHIAAFVCILCFLGEGEGVSCACNCLSTVLCQMSVRL